VVWSDCYEYAGTVAAGISGIGQGDVFEGWEEVRKNEKRQKITQRRGRRGCAEKEKTAD
jgi:hypothetical protein